MKRVIFKGIFIAAFFMSVASVSNAQAVTLPCDNPGNTQASNDAFGPHVEPCTPTQAPFDGGLSVLIAAGVGLGLKRRNEKKKKQQAEEAAV